MALNTLQQVGNYRILGEISQGRYANVYKAAHSVFSQRIVALKLLHLLPAGFEADESGFFQEARLLETLQHPHILPVIDAGLYGKYPYTVTAFASNGSLRDRLRHYRGHPLPLDEALPILKQAAEALQFAHQHKVVHSDVKPENILFDAQHSVLVSDFDIARILNRANAGAEGLGGTPQYMAPEQFQGKVRKESDQYALGCIAYELLTGKSPFHAENLRDYMDKHLHEVPVSPRSLQPALPEHIDQAIMKALEKKPGSRFADVLEFIQAIELVRWMQVGQDAPRLILKNVQQEPVQDEEVYYEATVVGDAAEPGQQKPRTSPQRRTARTKQPSEATASSRGHTTARKPAQDTPAKPATTKKRVSAKHVEEDQHVSSEAHKLASTKSTRTKAAPARSAEKPTSTRSSKTKTASAGVSEKPASTRSSKTKTASAGVTEKPAGTRSSRTKAVSTGATEKPTGTKSTRTRATAARSAEPSSSAYKKALHPLTPQDLP